MNLRALIIDDEQKGIDTLKLLIEKHISGIKIVAESTQPQQGIEMIGDYHPEIVFLDISMPGMNGFELLENLEWKQFSLVFTTAYREHALRAIRNNAADYLLKPIDHEELVMAVNRIKDKASSQTTNFSSFNYTDIFHAIHHSSRNKILLNSRLGIEPVDIDEIVSLESMSNYTHIHLSNEKKILSSKTLKEFDRLLCMNLDFMRVHHSFLINLRKVIRYIKETDLVVMANNQKIPVSKSRRDTFFKWLNA